MKTKVYIDKLLKKYIVPSTLRDTSITKEGVFTSGTRIPISKDIKYIRLYAAWHSTDKTEQNIDIDLSGAFVTEDSVTPISYYNTSESFAHHSGDFTSCKEYKDDNIITAEFIDLDIKKCKKNLYNYVLGLVNIYSGASNFDDVKVYGGIQLLTEYDNQLNSSLISLGDSFFNMELRGNYSSNIPIAIDLENNEIVIMDKYFKSFSGDNLGSLYNNLESYKELYFDAKDYQENMYDFLKLYISTKEDLHLVKDPKKADIIFSYKDIFIEGTKTYNISKNLQNILNLLNESNE